MTEEEFICAFEEALDRAEMTREEEKDYWDGVGTLSILVTLNIPQEKIFEFEILEFSGCVQGIEEAMGIDYLLNDHWYVQGYAKPFREGFIYTFHHITPYWIRGDGYTTDDDVEYSHGSITVRWHPWTWFKTKMDALWWKHIGWRFHLG